MENWELNEIMKRVVRVGEYKWELEFESEVDKDLADIVGIPLSARAPYVVAQDLDYDDATFIVHALQDIPRLVAEVERLNRLFKSARQMEIAQALCNEVQKQRIRELEQALAYYADEKNYIELRAARVFGDVFYEKGKLARSVLESDD